MKESIEKKAYKIREFCDAYGIGRSKFYQEVSSGRIRIFKVGTITLISAESAKRWLNLYESEAQGQTQLVSGVKR